MEERIEHKRMRAISKNKNLQGRREKIIMIITREQSNILW
jgi:hypothetical protein